jgi:hypothetical protein
MRRPVLTLWPSPEAPAAGRVIAISSSSHRPNVVMPSNWGRRRPREQPIKCSRPRSIPDLRLFAANERSRMLPEAGAGHPPRLLRGIGPRRSEMIRAAAVVSCSTTTPMLGVGPGQSRHRRAFPKISDRWRRTSRNEKVRGSSPLSSTKPAGQRPAWFLKSETSMAAQHSVLVFGRRRSS